MIQPCKHVTGTGVALIAESIGSTFHTLPSRLAANQVYRFDPPNPDVYQSNESSTQVTMGRPAAKHTSTRPDTHQGPPFRYVHSLPHGFTNDKKSTIPRKVQKPSTLKEQGYTHKCIGHWNHKGCLLLAVLLEQARSRHHPIPAH